MQINGKDIEVNASTTAQIETGRYRNAYKLLSEHTGTEGAAAALAIFERTNVEDGRKIRLRIDGAIVAVKSSDRKHRGTPPHDAATATGMYDHW
jgi:hypothetical protein